MRRPCSRLSVADRRADPRAARPVGHAVRGAVQRAVGVAPVELAGDPRQARAEHERLDTGVRGHRGLEVLQQHPRVGRHRAGDVAHQHDAAGPHARLAPAALHQLAAVAQRRAHGRAQVVDLATAVGGPGAAARAAWRAGGDAGQQPARRGPLGVRVLARSPSRAAAPPRSRRRAAGAARSRGAVRPRRRARRSGASPRARSRPAPRAGSRAPRRMPRTRARRHRRTGRARRGWSTARRAARRRSSARDDGVDRRQRPVGGEQLPHADACSAGAHERRELGQPGADRRRLTHRAAPRARPRARCPRAPSAPRRAWPRGRPRRRARAARAPT